MENLCNTDDSANAQNVRRGHGSLGIAQLGRAVKWTAKITVKGTSWVATRKFIDLQEAIKLYSPATLYHHGPEALLNKSTRCKDTSTGLRCMP